MTTPQMGRKTLLSQAVLVALGVGAEPRSWLRNRRLSRKSP